MKNDIAHILKIPFNKPYLTGKELSYIAEAHLNGQLAGDGMFTKRCQAWLEELGDTHKALLTHSCTAALEMAAILCDIGPGDEVIMPSYTFVSTANAFVLRGATPVFVDIRPDTLNIDETKIEEAITSKTKAIVPVHYAGVACEMDAIMKIAKAHGLFVIEDAAQALLSTYKGKQLGTIGDLGCFSFHETKNIISGEGGALMVNNINMVERAEIIREKGTNRSRFLRGQVDKYTWTDIGSSFLPGEITAAFLWAQLEASLEIIDKRKKIWQRYFKLLNNEECLIETIKIPKECHHNAHMFFIINKSMNTRDFILNFLNENGISAVFHYVPLHTSSYGIKFSQSDRDLNTTIDYASNLIRLPLWIGMSEDKIDFIAAHVKSALRK